MGHIVVQKKLSRRSLPEFIASWIIWAWHELPRYLISKKCTTLTSPLGQLALSQINCFLSLQNGEAALWKLSFFMDGMYFKSRENGKVTIKVIYNILGINQEGYKASPDAM